MDHRETPGLVIGLAVLFATLPLRLLTGAKPTNRRGKIKLPRPIQTKAEWEAIRNEACDDIIRRYGATAGRPCADTAD